MAKGIPLFEFEVSTKCTLRYTCVLLRRYGSGIATDMHKSKFVLTYDRNGKLLSKHQFSSHAGADSFSADTGDEKMMLPPI